MQPSAPNDDATDRNVGSQSDYGDHYGKYEWILIALMAVTVFFIYAKTLTGDFIFDDRHNIKNNPHIRLTQLSAKSLLDAAFGGPSKRRPVVKLSFALNHYLHGYNVVSFHLVNILIHIANGVLLYLLVIATGRTPAQHPGNGRLEWIAFFTACIWLAHPIQTEAVSYIVQRMTSLATLFYMLSLLFYVHARLATANLKKTAWFGAMAICGLLALGSKEISATLPFFLFIYEWYFFQNLSLVWIKKRIPLAVAVIILLVIISLFYLGGHPLEKISSMYATHHLTMAQRALTQLRVIVYYISLLLWPHPSRLNLDYDFQPSHSLLDPVTTLVGAIAIAGFLIVAVLTAKKQRLISFCILWYFGNLAIESSVIALEVAFEHRNYMPSMLFIFSGVLLCYRYLKPKWLPPLLLSAVAVICAFWTLERNEVWRSPMLIWQDSIKKSPQNPRPYNNLGVALADLGRYRLAVDQYRRALQINPRYADAHANLGHTLAKLGNIAAAIDHLATALEIDPNKYEAHNNLGIALAIQGRYQEAIAHFSTALEINPDFSQAINNLGVTLKKQGRLREAVAHFNRALKINPMFASAHNNLGMALAAQSRLDEAIAHFSKALEIDPNYAAARRNLEEILAKKSPSSGSLKE